MYYASLVEFIEPGPFHFSTSLMMLLAVIVGGSGPLHGPGGRHVIIILLPEFLRSSNIEGSSSCRSGTSRSSASRSSLLMIWLPGGILSFGDRFKKASGK